MLFAAPALAQAPHDFEGYVGRLDAAQLGEDWYLLTPDSMPSFPLEGATVRVLECEENCPAPVQTNAGGWFTIPGLELDSVRLRFDPPPCPEADLECEPLEPRQEVLATGTRTILGAKWPPGIEDTMLRYMPLIDGAIYVTREGEIPGLPGAGGAASPWIVWNNFLHGWNRFIENRGFVHEAMHLYEFRLRDACWYENRDIDGWILQERWLRVYDADRRRLEQLGLPLREPDGYELDEVGRGSETLAWFAGDYFMPEALMLQWPWYGILEGFKTYRELEQYAPNRYAYFEKIVFQRYLGEKRGQRLKLDAEEWPGMCTAPLQGDRARADRSSRRHTER